MIRPRQDVRPSPGDRPHVSQEQIELHWRLAHQAILNVPPYPQDRFEGRGIVLCAGGPTYFTCAWVCIRMLRRLGCRLSVELWHLGPREVTPEMARLLAPLDVRCVDALEVAKTHPARTLGGWECKPYAILHSRFREVLYLDADNVPVRDPEYLLDAEAYRRHGAVFWPDYGPLAPDARAWHAFEMEFRREADFESGQILVDKARCWPALQLTMHYNEYSDHYYRFIHGDKDTFHMAWRRLGRPYAIIPRPIRNLGGLAMGQHDFDGQIVFQHRNLDKWRLDGGNRRIAGFQHEAACRESLAELRGVWPTRSPASPGSPVPAPLPRPGVRLGLRLCMLTTPRSPAYIHTTLASLLASGLDIHRLGGVDLLADTDDPAFLREYDHHAVIRVHRLSPAAARLHAERSVWVRFCFNYWRCLALGRDSDGLIVLEDDVLVRDNFLLCLAQAVDEIERVHGLSQYILSMHSYLRLRDAAAAGRGGAYFLHFPPQAYFGTQGMYYPATMVSMLADYFWEHGVLHARRAGDMLIHELATRHDYLYKTVCDLVYHAGDVSTGLGGCPPSATFRDPWPCDQPSPPACQGPDSFAFAGRHRKPVRRR